MEAYSAPMHAAVLHQLQHASLERLLELLAYFRQREGPGLALVIAEIRARQARRALNYPSTFSL
ncbi:MAG: hypothetical protein ACRYFX_04895 [Janthinobacterium lividum]